MVCGIVFSLKPVKFERIERSGIFDGLVFMRSEVHNLLIGFERFLKVYSVFGSTTLSKGLRPMISQRTACLNAQRRSFMIFSMVLVMPKVIVVALLYDVSVFHKQDDVRITNGRQSVGDHKACSAAHKFFHRLTDLDLGTGIHA